jgi:flagellin
VTAPLTAPAASIAGAAAGSGGVAGDSAGPTAAAISVVLSAGSAGSSDSASITVGGIPFSHTFSATLNVTDAAIEYAAAWNADPTAFAAFTADNSAGTLVFTAKSAVEAATASATATYSGTIAGSASGSSSITGEVPTAAAISVILSAGSSQDDIAAITVGGITVSHTFAAATATASLAADAYAAAWNADAAGSAAFTATNSAGTLVFTAISVVNAAPAPVATAVYTPATLTAEQQSQESYDFDGITLAEGDRVSITITGGETYTQAFVTDKATTLNALGALVVNGEDGYVSKAITDGKLIFTGASDGTALAPATVAVESSSVAAADSINDLLVTDTVSATKALKVIDDALEMMADFRSRMGAVSNRMFMTVDNLMNVSENTSSARSRIVDADFALESANLAKAQILQKAGTAMLSQANASTQDILSLLK